MATRREGAAPLRRVAWAALLLVSVAGCRACEADYSKYQGPARSPLTRNPSPATAPTPAAPPAQPPPRVEATPTDLGAQLPPTGSDAAAEAEAPPREYAAELQAAVGNPIECLAPRLAADAPAQVAIALEAVVLESGYITRGSASSAALRPDELACVKQRVERARLGPNVEEAPRTVRGNITLTLAPSAAPVQQAPAPEVKPPGTVSPPSEALPAQAPPLPRSSDAIPYELPKPEPVDNSNAIPSVLPDPIPLQPTQP